MIRNIFLVCALIATTSPGTQPAYRTYVYPSPSPGLDFKREELPKLSLPKIVEPPKSHQGQSESEKAVPDLLPLVLEVSRYQELGFVAERIEPWVYVRGSEEMVADYEDSVEHLDAADEYLFEAMQEILAGNSDLIAADTALTRAKSELDQAELTIALLKEFALLEH